MTPEEKKVDKLEKVLSLIDEEYVKPDELSGVLGAISDAVVANREQASRDLASVINDTNNEVERLDNKIEAVDTKVQRNKAELEAKIELIELTPGEKGDRGEKGEKGEKGDKGDKGDPGSDATVDEEKIVEKAVKKAKEEIKPSTVTRFFGGGGSGPNIQSNGSPVVQSARSLNFTGATVTSTNGQDVTVAITGGSGAVDSVNGQTGVVVLDADDIDDTATTNKFVTAADITKIGNLSGTNSGDVTLTGEDYLSITGQQITANPIDLDNLSATGTPSSATFLRGDNTWATPAGSGDVSKVGTPADNQIGVWTGDGTIEGTNSLTFNGSTLAVTGDVTVTDEAYGVGWNGSTEVPTKNALYDKIETLSSGGITEELAIAYAVSL